MFDVYHKHNRMTTSILDSSSRVNTQACSCSIHVLARLRGNTEACITSVPHWSTLPTPCSIEYVQAGRPKKRFLFGHLFLNITKTNVFCAKK